jgi:hypothetical protein
MTDWNGKKVRDTFIEFFQSKEHTYVPSSGSVPVRAAGSFARRFSLPAFRRRTQGSRI